jgi:tryptophan synthase alpha subunit
MINKNQSMKNRINQLFETKKKDVLSIYFTAGFPRLNDTVRIIELLEQNGVDLVEIGIPFSDPTADGPTIQRSSELALKNGMSLQLAFYPAGRNQAIGTDSTYHDGLFQSCDAIWCS